MTKLVVGIFNTTYLLIINLPFSCLNLLSVCDALFLRSHQQFRQAPAPLNVYPYLALTELTRRFPFISAGPVLVIQ